MRQILFLFRQTTRNDFSKRFSLRHSQLRNMSSLNFSAALEGPFNFVDNVRCDPIESQETFEDLEPRSGKKICDVKVSGKEEVDRAVKAAKLAGAGWSKVNIPEY